MADPKGDKPELGADVQLLVTARGIGKGFTHTLRLRREGEEDVVAYQAKVKVVGVDAVR